MYFVILYFLVKVKYTFSIKRCFKNFLFLRSYLERLSVTGTNECKEKEVSWMFSFINVVVMVLCLVLYTFSYFSRTCLMFIVYFIPSVISNVDFVKIMVDVCNPQNYTKVKFVFYILLWSLTNGKSSNCKKCFCLFTSSFSYCITHKNMLSYKFS